MKKQNIAPEVDAILKSIPGFEAAGFKDAVEVNDITNEFVDTLKEFYPEINFSYRVENGQLGSWGKSSNFAKCFYNEIDYCRVKYGLTQSEKEFMMNFLNHLAWQRNILINSDGTPMTQSDIAKKTERSRTSVYRMMKSLEEKHCIYNIRYGRNHYYLVNPFLMFNGGKVNPVIPQLFVEAGFSPGDKNTKKEQTPQN